MGRLLLLAALLLLTGCASQPLQDDYAGQTAVVKDSFANYAEGDSFNSEHAELFAMVEVDGKLVYNGRDDTFAATAPDRKLRLRMVERRVPVKPMKVKIVGLVYYPQGFWVAQKYGTEKTASFTPVAGEAYVVRGKLGKSGSDSSVWIETASGKRVTE